jgi:hypothetical protein
MDPSDEANEEGQVYVALNIVETEQLKINQILGRNSILTQR